MTPRRKFVVDELCSLGAGLHAPVLPWLRARDAALESARLKCWAFMFTLHIFQIQGGTASPFNALATF